MKQIDEKLLNYCGIYKKPKLSERQKKEVLNKKRELEKRTGMKIEKVYAYGKNTGEKMQLKRHLQNSYAF